MNCKQLSALLVFLVFSLLFKSADAQQQNPSEGFKLFFEKVYLHLDRSYYVPGDDVWFKAYLVNAQNNIPFGTSNNLYVELIDPTAAIVSRKLIRMDSIGLGDFHLADSIAGGTYRIRAYTNWMRNFGNQFIFEKDIFVSEIPGVSKINVVEKNKLWKNKTETVNLPNKIQFLPEGGSLVEDVPTVMAFKTEDINGTGVHATGYILSSKGDTINLRTSHHGMGSFAFTPAKGMTYKAFVKYGNGKFTETPFPVASATGFVMNITNQSKDSVTVVIATNAASGNLYPSGIANIAARHAGKSYFKQQINLKDGKAVVSIPVKDFPGGIAYITLYDESMHPYSERLVYLDKDLLRIAITPDKNSYQSREKVTVTISVTDVQNNPVKTKLSLAAVEEGTGPLPSGHILSYLMLESDLKGKIENAASYFDPQNSNRLQQLDLLLRTQGWRSFLWRQLTDTTIKISYLPEAGITISGSVTKPFTNRSLENMHITLFAPEAKGDKIYVTKTNAQGKYYLDGLPLYGTQSVKLNVGDGTGKRVGELTMDSLFGNPLPLVTRPGYSSDSASFHSFSNKAIVRWTQFKNSQYAHMLPNVTVSTRRGVTLLRDGSAAVNFGYPEYNFQIGNDDYQYPRLRDFIIQKVPGAQYDDELEGVYFLSNGRKVRPILFVNNQQEVFGRLDYYSLSMKQIERVYIRHMVGGATYNSVGVSTDDDGNELNLESINPAIKDFFLVSIVVKVGNPDQQLSKLNVSVDGYYEARVFYAPNYSKENPEERDERMTIYWAPLITTDENGKARLSYYNADPKTKIRLNVQGITANGMPVFATSTYDVR